MNYFKTILILTTVAVSTQAANLVENGSFEQPSTGMATVTGWQSAHNAAGSLLRKKTKPSEGEWSLVVGRNRETGMLHGAATRTAHLVTADDSFELCFDWRPEAVNTWNKNDFIQYRLFTTDNNQPGGTAHELMNGVAHGGVKRAYTTLQDASTSSIPPDCLGKHLWLEIVAPESTQKGGAVRIDNLQLTTNGTSPILPNQPPERAEPPKQTIPAPHAIPEQPSTSKPDTLGLITASTQKPRPAGRI